MPGSAGKSLPITAKHATTGRSYFPRSDQQRLGAIFSRLGRRASTRLETGRCQAAPGSHCLSPQSTRLLAGATFPDRISKGSAQFFLDWVVERARALKLDDARQRREVIAYHRKARDYWQELLSQIGSAKARRNFFSTGSSSEHAP